MTYVTLRHQTMRCPSFDGQSRKSLTFFVNCCYSATNSPRSRVDSWFGPARSRLSCRSCEFPYSLHLIRTLIAVELRQPKLDFAKLLQSVKKPARRHR